MILSTRNLTASGIKKFIRGNNMQIISSTIHEAIDQGNGTVSVTEKHVYDDGAIYLHPYIAQSSWNLQEVADQRAANMNAAFATKAAQFAEAMNFEIPLTKTEFRDRFTTAEQIAIDNFNATYQSNPALTSEQKAAILSSLEHWKDTTKVYLGLQKTIDIVNLYESLGLIAAGRATQVLA